MEDKYGHRLTMEPSGQVFIILDKVTGLETRFYTTDEEAVRVQGMCRRLGLENTLEELGWK
jgi:hypothetical protein